MMNRCVFYSPVLNIRQASNYQEIMKQSKLYSQLLLLTLLLTNAVSCYASTPKYIDFEEMVNEADFIVIGTLSEVGKQDTMLHTIEIEEYLKNPRNDSQIILRITEEDTDGEGISNLFFGPFKDTGKALVFITVEDGFYRLLDGTHGVYRVVEKTSVEPDRWKVTKTWLTSRHEYSILYTNYFYDVVQTDAASSPVVTFLDNETTERVVHIPGRVTVIMPLIVIVCIVLAGGGFFIIVKWLIGYMEVSNRKFSLGFLALELNFIPKPPFCARGVF